MTTVQTNGHGPDNKNNMILNKAKRDFNKDLNRLPHKKGWKGIWLLEAGAQNYTGHIFSPFVTLYYHDTSTEYPFFREWVWQATAAEAQKHITCFQLHVIKYIRENKHSSPLR